MGDKATPYFYRSRLLERRLLWQQIEIWRRIVALLQDVWKSVEYIFSLAVDLLTGYGYHWWKALIVYPLVILGFALSYYLFGQHPPSPLTPLGAIVYSVVSFHGRGFFPANNYKPDDPVTVIAAFEAAVGLFTELIWLSMIVQRIRKR